MIRHRCNPGNKISDKRKRLKDHMRRIKKEPSIKISEFAYKNSGGKRSREQDQEDAKQKVTFWIL